MKIRGMVTGLNGLLRVILLLVFFYYFAWRLGGFSGMLTFQGLPGIRRMGWHSLKPEELQKNCLCGFWECRHFAPAAIRKDDMILRLYDGWNAVNTAAHEVVCTRMYKSCVF